MQLVTRTDRTELFCAICANYAIVFVAPPPKFVRLRSPFATSPVTAHMPGQNFPIETVNIPGI